MDISDIVVGIDLGTTNSLIGVYRDDGIELIPNAFGDLMTPSVVGFSDNNEVLVGKTAKKRLITHPELTTSRFKRLMGTEKEVGLGKKSYRAEELSAFVLRSLKSDAELFLQQKVGRAVISVPAYFNDMQRKATIAAAELAGLKVERLVNEPTAAALAYGLQSKENESTFLVADLGGGTFDVSILEMFDGVMEVRSSSGNAFLGGEDFTDAVLKELLNKLNLEKEDVSPGELERLRDISDEIKCELTENEFVSKSINIHNCQHTVSLNREEFESLTVNLLNKLRRPTLQAMSDASLTTDAIDRVVAVGGATRMPFVKGMITRMFKRFVEHGLDPDQVVAIGASVQAGLVARHASLEEFIMTDVTPFTMGIKSSILVAQDQYEHNHFIPIIERNTAAPVSRSHVGATVYPNQTSIEIEIYQGESPYIHENVKLGRLNVPVPRNSKEHEAVEVRFTYDVSGVLEVEVTVLSTQDKFQIYIEGNSGALAPEEIQSLFTQLEKIKIHPRDQVENTEMLARLGVLYEYHIGDQRSYLGDLIVNFKTVLTSQEERKIQEARTQLSDILDQFEKFQ